MQHTFTRGYFETLVAVLKQYGFEIQKAHFDASIWIEATGKINLNPEGERDDHPVKLSYFRSKYGETVHTITVENVDFANFHFANNDQILDFIAYEAIEKAYFHLTEKGIRDVFRYNL